MQPHLELQPIGEYRGNPRALVGLAGFLLDQRGEYHQLLRTLDRQIRCAPIPDVLDQPALLLLHVLDQLLARGTAREAIGVRKNRAFLRYILDVAGQHIVVQQTLNHLLRGQSFGDREVMLKYLAFDQRVDHFPKTCLFLELVLARLQLAPVFRDQDVAEEYPFLIDHTLAL